MMRLVLRPASAATTLDKSQMHRLVVGMFVTATLWCQTVLCHEKTDNSRQLIDTSNDVYDNDDDDDDDSSIDKVLGLNPEFDAAFANITVVAGQPASLPCSIDHLGKYKVAWLDHLSIPLTYEERRVIDDSRFSIDRPLIKDWNLQIRDTKKDDNGQYRCTINTFPVKSKTVQLNVKVPAQIIAELSSSDVTVVEGETLRLVCNVTGVPHPQVRWLRRLRSMLAASPAAAAAESSSLMLTDADLAADTNTAQTTCDLSSSNKSASTTAAGGLNDHLGFYTGEVLIVVNVSRTCGGIYECQATNEVPPVVTKSIRVTVEFPPKIEMANDRIIQWRGRETILECQITAYPHAVNYWEKDGRRVTSSTKHRIEAYDEGEHRLTLSLRIHIQEQADYGEYKCHASNSLGSDQRFMYLNEPERRQPADKLQDQRSSTSSTPPQVPHEQNVITLDRSDAPEKLPGDVYHLKSKDPSSDRVMTNGGGSVSCLLINTGRSSRNVIGVHGLLLSIYIRFQWPYTATHLYQHA